jgi:hypothetical protein
MQVRLNVVRQKGNAMRYIIAAMLATTILLGAHALSQDKNDAIVLRPQIMRLFIGSFNGQSYEVLYDGRELRYYSAPNMFSLKSTKPVIIKDNPKAWQAFFSAMDNIGVWAWKDRYEDPKIADGTVWSIVLVYNTQQRRALVNSGSNAQPDNFPAFLRAVSSLIENNRFE